MKELILLLCLFATSFAYAAEVDDLDALEGGAEEQSVAEAKPKTAEPVQQAPSTEHSAKMTVDAPLAQDVPQTKESDKYKCGKDFSNRVKSATVMFKEVLGIDNPFRKRLVQSKGEKKQASLIGDPNQPGQSIQIQISGLPVAPAKICKLGDGKLKIYGVGQKGTILGEVSVAFSFIVEKLNKTQVNVSAQANYTNPATKKDEVKKHNGVYNIQSASAAN